MELEILVVTEGLVIVDNIREENGASEKLHWSSKTGLLGQHVVHLPSPPNPAAGTAPINGILAATHEPSG